MWFAVTTHDILKYIMRSNYNFRRFCERNGIVMIAYSPFGSPDLPWGEKMPHILVDPVLKKIAEKYERSTAQIVLRWLLQRGLVTIPKVRNFLFFYALNL